MEGRQKLKIRTKKKKSALKKSSQRSLPAFEDGIDVEPLNAPVDFDMDISKLSLSDIRILRNSFAAKQGYCFMSADLRAIFSTTSWYDKVMEERFWAEDAGEGIEPISYTDKEKAFIEKLEK